MDDATVAACLAQVRAGDDAGLVPLWERFHDRMTAVAVRALRFRPHDAAADEDDIVSRAFEAFWARLRAGAYADLATRAGLWRLLRTFVTREALHQVRDAERQKRGGVLVSTEEMENRGGKDGQDPAALVEGIEQFLLILDRLAESEDGLWRIAVLNTRGWTNEEIAQELRCSVATVERRLADIRDLVSRDPER
jgi:DNA-directed RNA polymerase specialized sigma24 family protein